MKTNYGRRVLLVCTQPKDYRTEYTFITIFVSVYELPTNIVTSTRISILSRKKGGYRKLCFEAQGGYSHISVIGMLGVLFWGWHFDFVYFFGVLKIGPYFFGSGKKGCTFLGYFNFIGTSFGVSRINFKQISKRKLKNGPKVLKNGPIFIIIFSIVLFWVFEFEVLYFFGYVENMLRRASLS